MKTDYSQDAWLFQIYYDDISRKNLLPGFTPIENTYLTPYFENDVILRMYNRIIENGPGRPDYIGFFAHNFIYKAYHGSLANLTDEEGKYSVAHEIRKEVDQLPKDTILNFFPSHTKHPNPLLQSDSWHSRKQGSESYFSDLFKAVVRLSGISHDYINERTWRPGCYNMCNYWVFPWIIFEWYILRYLSPFMYELANNKKIKDNLFKDANYRGNPHGMARVKSELKLDYYPFHVFLCERLVSHFLNEERVIKIKNFMYEGIL